MKKNQIVFAALFMVASALFLIIGIIEGEAQSERIKSIERLEQEINRTAEYLGYESMGIIDVYEVSKRNGNIYDGPAITKELFDRKNMEVPDNTFTMYFATIDGYIINKLYVFEGERTRTQPVLQQPIKQIYLYGQV